MKLTVVKGVFVAESSYEERQAPKGAGFLWHGGGCRPGCGACAAGLGRVWWTKRNEAAARLAQYADEAAKAALNPHVNAVTASRATAAPDAEIPVPAGLAYLPYQTAGIAYAAARESTLIADEMGLGKTIQAIGVINADASIRGVLVVCPSSLRLNWQRELAKWLVRPLTIEVLDEHRPLPTADAQVVVVNYERARKDEVRAALMARTWDLLVVDEAHRIKNPKAQQTVCVLGKPARKDEPAIPGLVSRARRKVFLTGTPVLNRPIELHPLLATLAPSEFGNFMGFARRYCDAKQEMIRVRGGYKSVWNFDGASNLAELQERMRATCMIRRLKADVLTELPAKRRQIVVIPTNGAGKAVQAEQATWASHEDVIYSAQAEVETADAAGDDLAYEAAVARLVEARRVAFGAISGARRAVAMAKVDAVIEHVEDALEGTTKVILFAHHHDVIAALAAHFGSAAVVVTGETALADRQTAVDRFQTDSSVKLFIGSIGACREGLTLTAASTVIFAELDWVPANMSQAEDRAHRIGQTQSVLVQYLVIDGSLDAKIAHTLVEKQAIADAALDLSTAVKVPVIPGVERAARPRNYPAATEAQRQAAATAMRSLARVCDGAFREDNRGFSKIDVHVGHRLAALTRPYTDGECWLATKLATKYHRQLDASLLATLGGVK